MRQNVRLSPIAAGAQPAAAARVGAPAAATEACVSASLALLADAGLLLRL